MNDVFDDDDDGDDESCRPAATGTDRERTVADSFPDRRSDRKSKSFGKNCRVFRSASEVVGSETKGFPVHSKARNEERVFRKVKERKFYFGRGGRRRKRLMMLNDRVESRRIRLRNDNRLIFEINKGRKGGHCPG